MRPCIAFVLLCLSVIAIWANAADTAPKPADLIDGWWADLAKGEPYASHALLQFSDHPREATAYFQKHLKPLTLTREQLDVLLVDLGNDDENVWKPAFQTLEYLDPRLAVDLATLLMEADTNVRRRLMELATFRKAGALEGGRLDFRPLEDDRIELHAANMTLYAHNHLAGDHGWVHVKPSWQRAVRAIVLLDHFRTPEATALLEAMANGHPDADPTAVAKGAIQARRF